MDPLVRGGQLSGIAGGGGGGGLRTILHGEERAGEKKTLDCAVCAFIIPILFTVVATAAVTC